MKTLEKLFFQAVITKPDSATVREVVNVFTGLGYPYKQLLYYLKKWRKKGFYIDGSNLDLGWIEPDKITGAYKNILAQTAIVFYVHMCLMAE